LGWWHCRWLVWWVAWRKVSRINYCIMKKITWYWNLMHYSIYRWFNTLFRLINYINPIIYFYKIPGIKRFYAKRGIGNMKTLTEDIAGNPKIGINSINAGGVVGGLLVLLTFGIFNCSQIFFSISLGDIALKNSANEILFIAFLLAPSLLFNYFTLFKENKYLKYFKEFDEMDASEKTKYYWISLFVFLLILLFFIFSFRFTR
jgi:hypothetical protein